MPAFADMTSELGADVDTWHRQHRTGHDQEGDLAERQNEPRAKRLVISIRPLEAALECHEGAVGRDEGAPRPTHNKARKCSDFRRDLPGGLSLTADLAERT